MGKVVEQLPTWCKAAAWVLVTVGAMTVGAFSTFATNSRVDRIDSRNDRQHETQIQLLKVIEARLHALDVKVAKMER